MSKIDYTKQNFTQKEIDSIKSEVDILKKKYPKNIPIIVICKDDLILKKQKYLVNEDITLGQFIFTLRKRILNNIKSSEAIYLFTNNNTIPASSEILSIIYSQHKDQRTGMLYLTICKENTFG